MLLLKDLWLIPTVVVKKLLLGFWVFPTLRTEKWRRGSNHDEKLKTPCLILSFWTIWEISTDIAPLFLLNSAPIPKSGLRLIISVFTISHVNSAVQCEWGLHRARLPEGWRLVPKIDYCCCCYNFKCYDYSWFLVMPNTIQYNSIGLVLRSYIIYIIYTHNNTII